MPRDDSEYRNHEWGKKTDKKDKNEEEEPEEEGKKETANYGLSGLLASETRTWKGVELKFVEPMEARMPDKKWRLYEFKGDEQLRILHLHRCSCYIFGRDRSLEHFPGFVATDHPSCSKQHAVIQFRQHEKDDGVGGVILSVRPYLMDLKTTNGTQLNGERIDDMRYYELKERDNIKFGNSSRDYVLLHESST
ncbi:hypothetical protein GUITHDRAFT_116116 [Guillardia theta CCMP2712]|uniref:FHA domain-containing protein n=1 Tax=Guillardia theta (strain CCMP2712) TaxID=905079 RepID=L1INI2_GUITC|nr:hypothetical protein GUITHDRAFT_116116 [Guillardia theta CCMP2712]EKX37808.1 hypothetical protein GUITHDRAFT_116116 [Guillardia theta CCMP2712]|eukprot:XP_005824788.1 hypothetical protein GUITHDRAFT_116116 [Guillardia theta CCMP2712]